MRCPKCKYVFSEELKICPRCNEDMGDILEKIGVFPISSKEPFLFPEDFIETPSSFEHSLTSEKREIEFPSTKNN